jgi:hypothetical protein
MSSVDRDSGALRRSVSELLRGGNAHVTLWQAAEGLQPPLRGRRPERVPYSVWEVLEHMRIAQEDILRYTLDPSWRSPSWPEGYWPDRRSDVPDAVWTATLDGFEQDRNELIELFEDPGTELTAQIPHGGDRTYLRQALVAADHNAYHLGQIVTIRRALDAWES